MRPVRVCALCQIAELVCTIVMPEFEHGAARHVCDPLWTFDGRRAVARVISEPPHERPVDRIGGPRAARLLRRDKRHNLPLSVYSSPFFLRVDAAGVA